MEKLKKENKESIKIKSPEESTQKAIEIKSLKKSIEIKSPNEGENTTDWYNKNKLRQNLLLLAATNLITKLK